MNPKLSWGYDMTAVESNFRIRAAPLLAQSGVHSTDTYVSFCARWYYEYNSGLQNQSVLYSSLNASLDGSATAVLDPNALSGNGSISVSGYTFSGDGRLMAFRMSRCWLVSRFSVSGHAVCSARALRACTARKDTERG